MCRRQGVRPCRVGTSYVEDRIMTVVCGLLQVVGKGKVVDHASESDDNDRHTDQHGALGMSTT